MKDPFWSFWNHFLEMEEEGLLHTHVHTYEKEKKKHKSINFALPTQFKFQSSITPIYFYYLFLGIKEWERICFYLFVATFSALWSYNSTWCKDSFLWSMKLFCGIQGFLSLIPLLLFSWKERLGEDVWVLRTPLVGILGGALNVP